MTIAISIADAFDIEDRDGLIAYIIAHLELDSETAAQVPTFIRKAEYRLNRLVLAPERETSVTFTTTAGVQDLQLPVDYRQIKSVRYVADEGYALRQVSADVLNDQYTNLEGKPRAYAVQEQSLRLGPVPDGEYEVRMVYVERITPLTEANPTNWLLSTNADVYVYSTLWQAAAWLEDIDAATAFRAEMMEIIDEINASSNRYRRSGTMRLRSPVVV
jgi:hypothetical protein